MITLVSLLSFISDDCVDEWDREQWDDQPQQNKMMESFEYVYNVFLVNT